MNKNRYWIQNRGFRFNRGGCNRGGRGGNRGNWPRHRGGFMGPNDNYGGFGGGGNRYQKNVHPNTKHWLNRQQQREKRDTPGKRLSEDLIGVTEYISNHEGFNGIIKSRYSDFQVSEMNEKGEIAKLTNMIPPVRPTDDTVDDDEDLLLNKYNLEILPMETWDKINSLAVNTGNDDDKSENQTVEIDMEGVTKEQRTKIHDAVKKAFGDSIVGCTVNVDDKKFMRFEKYRKGVRIDNRVKWVWPGEYVYFIVHKENCDTMDAAARIAERIGVHLKPSMIGYAGTKDRRAKTSQWFSVKRVDPGRIAGACRYLRDIQVGNYSFSDTNLKLGMLKGNKFRIALRNVTADEESVDAACRHLKEQGFINYYGLQRFGSRIDTPTYDIGLKLLQGNLKEAIDAILEPREGSLYQALVTFKEKGATEALKYLPRRVSSTHGESRVIKSLSESPKDLVGAIGKLARNIRLLYLHSYQSLVWNRAVSERIRRYGLTPVAGDIVPAGDVEIKDPVQVDSDSEDGDMKDEDVGPSSASDTPEIKTENKPTKPKKGPKPPVPVKILTQEDIDSGKYNVFDIVLPLPGAFVVYPPNMTDYYEEVLTKDGLKMDMKHKIKSYNMAGAYRHMLVRPLDVQWQHARYNDPFADLIPSDRDELESRKITGIVEDGKYRALILNMILPSSCYATMALRELLKIDTSSDNQALLNNYHKRSRGDVKDSTTDSGDKADPDTQSGDQQKMDTDGVGNEISNNTNESDDVKNDVEKESEAVEGVNSDKVGEKRKLEEDVGDIAKKIKTD